MEWFIGMVTWGLSETIVSLSIGVGEDNDEVVVICLEEKIN